MSCSIASYLNENKAKNLQNGDVHLAQIPDFEMENTVKNKVSYDAESIYEF